MKKTLYSLLLVLLMSAFFFGCGENTNTIYYNNKKPNNFYYTNLLSKNIKLKSSTKCKAIDMNYYREIELEKDNLSKIAAFLDKLNKENFIEAPHDLPQKPKFKLSFISDNDIYVINVYNNKYISVYPWDGSYEMDFIDMTSIPASLNIFEICKFLYSL